MTLAEDIVSKRKLMVFIGEENHSSSYKPYLFDSVWDGIPDSIPSKDVLIIPIKNLDAAYIISQEKVNCYGKSLWLLFVKSAFLTHNVILFDTFPQTSGNTYFSEDRIGFLQRCNCRTVTVCDIGVYKSASLMNLLNSAIESLAALNISVCLTTILGYNSRGYTDIETEDEHSKYVKEYYLKSNFNISAAPEKEVKAVNDSFSFLQIDKKFNLGELLYLCCITKSPAEIKLQELKQKESSYTTLKLLLEHGYFRKFITKLNAGISFDFKTLDDQLNKIGFIGNLVDSQWPSHYKKLCQEIRNANLNNRGTCVSELASAIEKNINCTISYIKSI